MAGSLPGWCDTLRYRTLRVGATHQVFLATRSSSLAPWFTGALLRERTLQGKCSIVAGYGFGIRV